MTDCHAAVQKIRQKVTRARTALKLKDYPRLELELQALDIATKHALTLFTTDAPSDQEGT